MAWWGFALHKIASAISKNVHNTVIHVNIVLNIMVPGRYGCNYVTSNGTYATEGK